MKSFREIVVLTFHNLSSCIALPILIIVLCIGCSVRKEQTPTPVTITEKPTWQIVETKYGKVKAEDGESETWLWKAIPYARPPVGPLRWKAPRNPNPWEGIREAKEFCEICPQYNFSKKIVGNEDCLYLNIWRPKSSEKDLPVYFWIHGGGNSIQSPYLKDFSCGSVVKKSNVIVVTMNYRLGPMGWFTHPALRSGKQGGEYDDSGNHGTLDLIKALEWVKDNIKAFGGNPENILIGGESAGARNVLTLIISPAAKGLFHKAMSQSGGQRTYSLSDADESAKACLIRLMIEDGSASDENSATSFLTKMSDSEIQVYLRSKTSDEILAAYETRIGGMLTRETFISVFRDGHVIPETGFDTLQSGTYPNKVLTILGTNKDETKLFLFMNPVFKGKDELYRVVASYGSDLWKVNGVDEIARRMRLHEKQPNVYVYQFLWGTKKDSVTSVIPPPWDFKLGACHGLDIPFFFDKDQFFGPLTNVIFKEENYSGRKALTKAMMTYVANFAHSGDPNKPESVITKWEPWSNVPGIEKCILFDADAQNVNILMSTIELTEEGVKSSMANEVPEPLYSEAKKILKW